MFTITVFWLSILFVFHISYGLLSESVQLDNNATKKNKKSIFFGLETLN